ncbi:hypothetical protein [Glaciimonas sp. PCH181]|uniref:hypothetical protein n=1 Tax=Glaciimonas sp. PCH181 TaxID=2133943 RepID=UPI000D362109|nr:hypothetical protein [Glaciimonas sp. PCH181]PUA20493.1 hypothetical protein C7W93_12300 [Glaciimonas sp. PCH181]
MSLRKTLLVFFLSAFTAISAHAGEINFSSDHDFLAINLNIKDQGLGNAEFVVLSVTLTPMARRRLEEASRGSLQQDMTISLDGNIISTTIVRSVMKSPHLKLSLSREMARNVFPSLLSTPVQSISLSGYAMPNWTQGTWAESLTADAPNTEYAADEKLSISSKTLNAPSCKHVNHTVVATSDSVVELRVDRRNKCVLDEVSVAKMILTRTTEAERIVISLYAIGSDFNGPPTRESTYRRQ